MIADIEREENADLKGVKILELVSDQPAKIYCPGDGHVYNVSVIPIQEIGGINLRQLARLQADSAHPLAVEIDAPCAQGCGSTIRAVRLFAGLTSCETCCERKHKEEKIDRKRVYWESLCPPQFRDTDRTHVDFPRGQYEATKDFDGGESLFFIGATRKGKTRLAMLLLKRCLVRHNLHVGVLWPEEMKQVRANNVNRLDWVHRWGRFDLLLWDDALLTGAQDERITDALKDLLDYRMRWKRKNIFTSQVGGETFTAQAGKFDNATAADMKRVEALIGRLRETCRVIVFTDIAPSPTRSGEQEEAF